jgi:hypothetical protein
VGPGHFQLAHHDAQHRLQHFFRPNRRMHLPRDLQQCLQAGHLLLQVNHVGMALEKEEVDMVASI